jgi:CPA2 family monovalent cation:H+ antiporter-2
MPHVPLVDELALVAAVSVLVIVLLARLKLPTVAGLLVAGALIGPFGLRLVKSVHAIETLAEVGVVLLLFTIGLEFSLNRLRHIFRRVALGGALQVGLTTAAVAAIATWLGQPMARGIFYGFVFALSSTAIVLRALSERQELDAPHGRFIVGTLIFQDLCVVPMVLIIPVLGRPVPGSEAAVAIGLALGKAALVMAATVAISRLVVPRVLALVDASRSREVFLLAILALCIGTAWLTSMVGLSLALGAFLGGMVVADTDYSHRALSDVLPLRDAFVSVFFVSLGMLFDVRIVLSAPLLVGALLLGFLVIKGAFAAISAAVMQFPARATWLAAVGLAQFGEFGFVLVRVGEAGGVVGAEATRPLLAAGILSMFLTPLAVRAAPHIAAGERLVAPLERLFGARSIDEAASQEQELSGHVVIVGFGMAGRVAAEALEACGVRQVVLEMNAVTVRQCKAAGLPVYYADATSPEALGHAHLQQARALVLLINDPEAAERVVAAATRVAPQVPVLVRSRYFAGRDKLLSLGARDVVSEELEATVEVLARLLRWLEVPRNIINERVTHVRSETQSSERALVVPRPTLQQSSELAELKIESILVRPHSCAAGCSPVSLDLRARTGALLVAVRRGDKLLEQPDPNDPLQEGDIAYLVGSGRAVGAAIEMLDQPAGGRTGI